MATAFLILAGWLCAVALVVLWHYAAVGGSR